MWRFKSDGENKAPLDHLFQAYKIGGFPFALFTLGAMCLLAAFGVARISSDKPLVDPVALVIAGSVIVIAGGLVWAVALQQRTRFQMATIQLIRDMSHDVATVVKDGANYKVGLEDVTKELPKLLNAIGSAAGEQPPDVRR